MRQDMSGQVEKYADLVASLARWHSKAAGTNAEYDDLYQEGLIAVWQTLERGATPAKGILEMRMIDWKRLMKFQSGSGGHKDTSYATLLPLEDFHQLGGQV